LALRGHCTLLPFIWCTVPPDLVCELVTHCNTFVRHRSMCSVSGMLESTLVPMPVGCPHRSAASEGEEREGKVKIVNSLPYVPFKGTHYSHTRSHRGVCLYWQFTHTSSFVPFPPQRHATSCVTPRLTHGAAIMRVAAASLPPSVLP
jgi:hypothetical protein